MTHVQIVRASANDTDLVINIIGEAFHTLVVASWLVPDAVERRHVLPASFEPVVDHAAVHGIIDLTEDGDGAAVWLPSSALEPAGYEERLAAVCGEHTPRFRSLADTFNAHHPRGRYHEYLVYLAVKPDRQGLGLGTALLRHHHEQLDRAGHAAYLETSESQAWYARRGWRTLSAFTLLDGGGAFWGMWRDPAGSTGNSTEGAPHDGRMI